MPLKTRRTAIHWLGVLGLACITAIVVMTLSGHDGLTYLGYGLTAAVTALASLTPPPGTARADVEASASTLASLPPAPPPPGEDGPPPKPWIH